MSELWLGLCAAVEGGWETTMRTVNSRTRPGVQAVIVLCAAVAVLLAPSGPAAFALPRVEVVLSLPYGSGPGQVGATKAGDPVPEATPECPAMFWMTQQGIIWVLDSVNSRVLAFRDGKQIVEICTRDVEKLPQLFGVTRGAVFVVQIVNVNGPECRLVRYDPAGHQSTSSDLRLPDGRPFLPMKVMPLGREDETVLISGRTHPSEAGGSLVLDSDGKIVSVQVEEGPSYGSTHMPAADGTVWRMVGLDLDEETEVPLTLERYDADTKAWTKVSSRALPRRPQLWAQRKQAFLAPLGVDADGAAAVVLSEGTPLSPRFLRLGPSGEVAALTLEDLGVDSAPLGTFFAPQHFQLLPDGSILAQYASPERYQVTRLVF